VLWPILISLSVTPGPYFLSCAAAVVAVKSPAASNAIVVRMVSSCICAGLSTGQSQLS
jgi:hypothetical protein